MRNRLAILFAAVAMMASAKLPELTFVAGNDTIKTTYDDAPRELFNRNWPVDYNSAEDKFLSDEGLGRYRSVKDDVLARVAVARMFNNAGFYYDNPPRVSMLAQTCAELNVSPCVFRQLTEMMDMITRNANDKYDFSTIPPTTSRESVFHDLGQFFGDREVWTRYTIDPNMNAETSFTYPSPSPQGKPQMLRDTITGIIDYNPWRYNLTERMPVARELGWWLKDMTAKSRFFGHVTKGADGKLHQNATAEELRLSPQVWEFFSMVLDGLNEDTPRVNNLIDTWPTDADESQKQAEAFFLDKNRGASVRIFKRNGEPMKYTDTFRPRTMRPSAYDYRLDILRDLYIRDARDARRP